MKNLKVLLALAFGLCAFGASAQLAGPTYGVATAVSYIGISTNVAGSAATNLAAVISCGKQASVTVQAVSRNDASGTAAMGYFFQRSVDGVSYETTGQYVTIAANGTSDAILITNLPTLGCGYIKLAYLTNAAAATVNTTNLVVKYGVKMSAP